MIRSDGETHGETYIRIDKGICILKKIYREEQRQDTDSYNQRYTERFT